VRNVAKDTLTTEKLVEERLLLREVRNKTSQKEKALIPKNQGFVDLIWCYGFGTTGIVPTALGLGTTGIVPTALGFGTTGIVPTAFAPPKFCVTEIAKFVAITSASVMTSARNRRNWLFFDMVDS